MIALPLPAPCPGCPDAQLSAAQLSASSVCLLCAQVWQAEPAPPPCESCAHLRESLRRQRNARAYQRCDDCGELVTVSERGLERFHETITERGRRADARLRRAEMLRALDHWARWKSKVDLHSTEPSPIVGDGNKGGGVRLERSDRSDGINDDHHALALAFEIERTIERVVDGHAREILRWLPTHCTAVRRRKIVEAIAHHFVERPAAAARVRRIAALTDRGRIVVLATAEIDAERARLRAAHSGEALQREIDATREQLASASDPADRARLLFALQDHQRALASRAASLNAALRRLDERVRHSADALSAAQVEAAVAKVPRLPTAEQLKLAGAELLRITEAAWWAANPPAVGPDQDRRGGH